MNNHKTSIDQYKDRLDSPIGITNVKKPKKTVKKTPAKKGKK